MKELAEILQKTREDRGAIDFDTNEAKVLVDEKGKANRCCFKTTWRK